MPRASSRSSSSADSSSSPRAREQLLGRERVLVQLGAREPDVQRHRDQPLLGAVVQVALEPPPLLEPDLEHALARAAQLGDLRAQLGVQPLVLEREPGGRPHRLHVPAHLRQRRVVHDRGHALAVAVHLRDRSRGVPEGQLVLAPARVDVVPLLGQPEQELERRVLERLGERVAHPARARGRAQLRHQLAHRAALRHARAHERGQEQVRNQRQRDDRENERDLRGALAESGRLKRELPHRRDQQRDARGVNGGVEAALRPRGAPPAPDQAHQHGHDQDDPDQVHDPAPDVHDRLVVLDQDRVLRTPVAVRFSGSMKRYTGRSPTVTSR